MRQIKNGWKTFKQKGWKGLAARTVEFIQYRGRALWVAPFRLKRSQAAWDQTLADLKKEPILSPEDYRKHWGELRLRHYRRWGPFPCPPGEVERLASLKDKYKGERIFIIGNGPSINRTPLEKLNGEYTFGLNRIYLLYDRIDWRPTFWTVTDWRVGPDNAEEINRLGDGTTFFFPQRFDGLLRHGPDVYWYWMRLNTPPGGKYVFSTDPTRGLYMGHTVGVTAIELAFFMGFDPIYLIGTDCSYKVLDTVAQSGNPEHRGSLTLVSSQDDDPNHFDSRYFGKGRVWSDPDVAGMMAGFAECGRGIRAQGRRIYNATVGGQLEVLERTPFDSLF